MARRPGGNVSSSRRKVTFADVAEEWYSVKTARVRPWTLKGYRSSLDLIMLPRFAGWQLAAIDADAIATLTRDLEREGLHAIDPKRKVRPIDPRQTTSESCAECSRSA